MTFASKRPWLPALAAVLLAILAIPAAAREAPLVDLEGAIGPASAIFVADALTAAQREGAPVLVLRIDTPGGLDSAMRAIVKAITASTVPVIGYVAPGGARAASAGTYILSACQVAAMAPGTNLGAATPVQIGGLTGSAPPAAPAGDGKAGSEPTGDAMTHKLVNDATAYLRSLAELRGRNADWAERAVRDGASLSAEAALKLQVIDLIAPDLGSLLAQTNGRTVVTAAGPRALDTAALTLVERHPSWPDRFLGVLSDPNIAYILLLLGFYGLVYELANPGTVLPGTVGAICLLLALYAFQLLPVSWAGLALIGLGLGLMIAEAFVASFGALGLGGIAAFVIGSLILIDTDAPGYAISRPLIGGFAVASAVLLVLVVGMAVKAQRRPVATGGEQLIGALGTAVSGFPGAGSVHLHGEIWSANSPQSIPSGTAIRVLTREGLTLSVEPVADKHLSDD
ncbi:nodulation protein NfeD [uncultured Thiodictyon sp.]|uniref:NfeD family protein n=1 Tax=uncultured Thiodictyon sp. TaxID=1846217 RepID=UPI0025F84316|nr:nodulation protein NfeD [uncultured Thiodictyon sp.]